MRPPRLVWVVLSMFSGLTIGAFDSRRAATHFVRTGTWNPDLCVAGPYVLAERVRES